MRVDFSKIKNPYSLTALAIMVIIESFLVVWLIIAETSTERIIVGNYMIYVFIIFFILVLLLYFIESKKEIAILKIGEGKQQAITESTKIEKEQSQLNAFEALDGYIAWDFDGYFLGLHGKGTDTKTPIWSVGAFQATGRNINKEPITNFEGYILIDRTHERFPISLNVKGNFVDLSKMIALPPNEEIKIIAHFGLDIDDYPSWKGIEPEEFLTRCTPFTFVTIVNDKESLYPFSREDNRKLIEKFKDGCRPKQKGPVIDYDKKQEEKKPDVLERDLIDLLKKLRKKVGLDIVNAHTDKSPDNVISYLGGLERALEVIFEKLEKNNQIDFGNLMNLKDELDKIKNTTARQYEIRSLIGEFNRLYNQYLESIKNL